MFRIISYTLLSIFISIVFATTISASQVYNITTCIALPGYVCPPNGTVSNGQVSLTRVGQMTGTNFYNVEFACTTNNSLDTYETLNYTPPVQIQNDWESAGNSTWFNGASTNITNLQCYGNNGTAVSGQANDPLYAGNIWISYTLNNTAYSSSNPRFGAPLGAILVNPYSSTTTIQGSTGGSGLNIFQQIWNAIVNFFSHL